MTAKMAAKETHIKQKINEKEMETIQYRNYIKQKNLSHATEIQRVVRLANRKMDEICAQGEIRIAKLQEEAIKTKNNYNDILAGNKKAYKELKEKKDRVLANLQMWIRKYDEDVKEKILENKKLEKEYAECMQQLNEFEEKYKNQEVIYKQLVKDKELDERRTSEEKLMLFMMNRAAKIIQQAWRRYMSKRKKGKGKGKGKKGKKGGKK